MKKALAILITAIALISCAGCSEQRYESISDITEATAESTEPLASAETESADITTEINTIESSEQSAETSEPAEVAPPTITEQTESVTYPSPEEGHIFIDFEYIENVQSVPESELHPYVYENAVYELSKQEEYISACKDVTALEGADIGEYLDENGTIVPKLYKAVLGDFNGNGGDDYFVLLTSPCESSFTDRLSELYWLLWVSDNGGAYYLDVFRDSVTEISVLDYGICQQLIVCNNGTFGAGCASGIYGISDDKAVCHYSFRGNFTKVDCFINASGWQGSGDFMYYDTVAEEYRCILPDKVIPFAELLEMDKTGSLDDYKEDWDGAASWPIGQLMCGKFWCISFGPMHHGGEPYLYENGGFVYCYERYPVRASEEEQWGGRSYVSGGIDYDEAVTTMLTPEEAGKREIWHVDTFLEELTEISPDNVFIDYEYIDEYEGLTDPAALDGAAEAALGALLAHENYAALSALTPDMSEQIITHENDPAAEEFFDENGKVQPIFHEAFREDFNGDGKTECFVAYRLPIENSGRYHLRYYLIFVNSDGNAEVVNDYYTFNPDLLDYGAFKHLIINGAGYCGADSHSSLFGVVDNSAKLFCELRGDYIKWKCFLTADGWQTSGDFMYYDTIAEEYRSVVGELVPLDVIKEMDYTGALADYTSGEFTGYPPEISLIGGKYYVAWSGWMDSGRVFTYENGKFISAGQDCYIRLPGGITEKGVKIEDIDAVIASMLSPEEALKQKQAERLPSEGHIFVDFSYITDYKGTTDITECGKWYSMALNFLKLEEDYIRFNELLKNEDLANIKYYETAFAPDITDYLDENGNIQPILSGAYIDDYDQNGQDECFLLLDIPYYVEISDYWITRSYLYYGNGKGIKYLNDFSNICEISMLDYGLCRQFIIRAYGTMGADEGALIYGVVDGEVVRHYSFRGGFTKVDCFINASGWMGFGDFMYYDTVRQQYRAVASEHIPTPTILEMDSTGAFSKYYDDYENDPASLPWFMLVGGKYYCLWRGVSDVGTPYLYENGCFVPCEDNVRVSAGLPYIELDYDSAIASMLSPEQAAHCT